MKRKNRRQLEEKGSIELLEEAVELLRTAPVSALAAYYLGGVPFGLGFLYFWADMTRSSMAYQTLSQEALGVALLFVWMKTWQTIFTRVLWNHLSMGQALAPNPGRLFKTILVQSALQPWGLLVLPIASLILLPFGWVYAFFQNVTVMGWGGEESLKEVYQKSWKLAKLWPRQNHLMLGCLMIFSFFVLMNLETGLYWGPLFLKEFLGIETVFTRSFAVFNTTYTAVTFLLAYLCLDPLIKAAYTLRCFYGESLESGEDLKSELKAAGLPAAALVVVLLALGPSSTAWAQSGSTGPAPAGKTAQPIAPPVLDKAIQDTLQGEEYQWHMPRVKPKEELPRKQGIMEKFLDGSLKLFIAGVRKVVHWLDEFGDWWTKHFGHHGNDKEDIDKRVKTQSWDFEYLYIFLWVLLAAAACALALLLYRLWMRRDKTAVLAEAVLPKPDVADEKVSGSELPMDGWMAMAQDLLKQGNLRLALRAFYLASLSFLAHQRLLTIAKFKSTRDYERELNRRGHSFPSALSAFSENGLSFDRGWYGDYEVTTAIIQDFAKNLEKIKSTVEPPIVSGRKP